jgi:hypothetical protein
MLQLMLKGIGFLFSLALTAGAYHFTYATYDRLLSTGYLDNAALQRGLFSKRWLYETIAALVLFIFHALAALLWVGPLWHRSTSPQGHLSEERFPALSALLSLSTEATGAMFFVSCMAAGPLLLPGVAPFPSFPRPSPPHQPLSLSSPARN